MTPPESSDGGNLAAFLALTVPLEIARLKARGRPDDDDWEGTRAFGQELAEHGDELLYRTRPGRAAQLAARSPKTSRKIRRGNFIPPIPCGRCALKWSQIGMCPCGSMGRCPVYRSAHAPAFRCRLTLDRGFRVAAGPQWFAVRYSESRARG